MFLKSNLAQLEGQNRQDLENVSPCYHTIFLNGTLFCYPNESLMYY